MKDVALDLSATIQEVPDEPKLWRRASFVWAAVVAVALLGVAWNSFTSRAEIPLVSSDNALIAKIGGSLDLDSAAFSQDGKFLAFINSDSDRLQLRHIESGRDVELLKVKEGVSIEAVSPDAGYIYFKEPTGGLYRIPVLGGVPQLIFEAAIIGGMSFSPDGAKVVVGANKEEGIGLWLLNADGTSPRLLVSYSEANQVHPLSNVAWSPNGSEVVVWNHDTLISIDPKSGSERRRIRTTLELDNQPPFHARTILFWQPDGSGLVARGFNRDDPNHQQNLWFVPWPNGPVHQITAESGSVFSSVMPIRDGSAVLAVRHEYNERWRVADVTRPDSSAPAIIDCEGTLTVLRTSGRMLCDSSVRLVSMAADGGDRYEFQLPVNQEVWSVCSATLADTLVVTTVSKGTVKALRMWRVGAAGGQFQPVPHGENRMAQAISPDGATVYFTNVRSAPDTGALVTAMMQADGQWQMPLAGGEEQQVGPRLYATPHFSPDGRFFYRFQKDPAKDLAYIYEVFTTAEARFVWSFKATAAEGGLEWAPSSDALLQSKTIDGVRNIWNVPISGASPRQITRFGKDELGEGPVTFSADGSRLFFKVQESLPADVIRITNFRRR